MLILASYGCQDESQLVRNQEVALVEANPNNANSALTFNWYLDNVLVNEGVFDPLDTTLFVATLQTAQNSTVFDVRAFSTEIGYVTFGNLNGLPFAKQLEFENLMEVELERGEPSQERLEEIYDSVFSPNNLGS